MDSVSGPVAWIWGGSCVKASKIVILRQFLAIDAGFVRKVCAPKTKNRNFATFFADRHVCFVRKVISVSRPGTSTLCAPARLERISGVPEGRIARRNSRGAGHSPEREAPIERPEPRLH